MTGIRADRSRTKIDVNALNSYIKTQKFFDY